MKDDDLEKAKARLDHILRLMEQGHRVGLEWVSLNYLDPHDFTGPDTWTFALKYLEACGLIEMRADPEKVWVWRLRTMEEQP